ncbi:MAG: alginate lyase family protein [Pseudomonadota bacterium]
MRRHRGEQRSIRDRSSSSQFGITYFLLRHLGPRVVWLRAQVYFRKYFGLDRKTFAYRPWTKLNLSSITKHGTPTETEAYAEFKKKQCAPFLFPLGEPPSVLPSLAHEAQRHLSLEERIELLKKDRCVYFFRTPSPNPIDWYTNPFHNKKSDSKKTVWCDIPDYLPEQGDPRMLWEPARAAWAIDLARATARGNKSLGSLFWRWTDSWMSACPPFRGFQWKCGQESSVRFIAIATGFWALANSAETTPERWVQFARLAWATGYRIFRHLDYALSQKNNHALSEACGLLLVSLLFPEFRDAPKWQSTAIRILSGELRRQLYEDGTYLQHSVNYHRVMLDVAVLALRLAEVAHMPFEQELYNRLERCSEFLFQMMELDTGQLPQYGNNDGAYVLPFSECDFTDFRPTIQAAQYLTKRRRILSEGPWDEQLLWLFGKQALSEKPLLPRIPKSTAFDVGGYYTLRSQESWAMVRCHTYRDRTAQCDQLHTDLWWRGMNILQDCGTFQYYSPERPDLEYFFKSTAAHNTVEIDGQDPLERVSRFLWFPWSKGKLRRFDVSPTNALVFEGENLDYARPPWNVLHRRAIVALKGDFWVVIDDVLGKNTNQTILRWHMLDSPYSLRENSVALETPRGKIWLSIFSKPACSQELRIVRGQNEPGETQGFVSPYYGELLPSPTLECVWRCQLPQRILTVIGPEEKVRVNEPTNSSDYQRWEMIAPTLSWVLQLSQLHQDCDRIVNSIEIIQTNGDLQ